jgi:hypothetical protein
MVDGVLHDTLAAAATTHGLLQNEVTAHLIMVETLGGILTTPVRARLLLLLIIGVFPCDVPNFIDTYLDHLAEPEWSDNPRQRVLADLERRLQNRGKSLADYNMEPPVLPDPDELLVDPSFLPENVQMQHDQQLVFDRVMRHLDNATGAAARPLFLHVEGEPGGGKSFLINVILNHLRNKGLKATASAFPAKVARMYEGGQTIHHFFKFVSEEPGVPIVLDVEPPDGTSRASERGRVLFESAIISMDEITMMRKDELDAIVDKLDEIGFVGVLMIVGNCAQLGPVILGKGLPELIEWNITRAACWDRFEHLRLTGQMRCKNQRLRQAIHDIGYGCHPTINGVPHSVCPMARVRMPTDLFPAFPADAKNLAEQRAWVHGAVNAPTAVSSMQACIVCATNALAEQHNNVLLDMVQGPVTEYKARDEVIRIDDRSKAQFDTSHLTDATSRLINKAGTALHTLRLKVGVPVHLMLNIDKSEGLVKGALAYVVAMSNHTVTIKLALNKDARRPVTNDTWILPRLCFSFKPHKMPIKVNRFQIPLRLAWASTVHRVQGDDLQKVLVDLRHPFFAHGQLEVANSRGHDVDNTHYLVDVDDLFEDHFVCTNVVVPQVLWEADLQGAAPPPHVAPPCGEHTHASVAAAMDALHQGSDEDDDDDGEWDLDFQSSSSNSFLSKSEPSIFQYSMCEDSSGDSDARVRGRVIHSDDTGSGSDAS